MNNSGFAPCKIREVGI